jgi:hypothetical protein
LESRPVWLTVRSFLGWFARIGTEPRSDVHREVQEREKAPLHTGQGREMRPPAPPISDDRQRHALKPFQQARRRGADRGPFRVAGRQPGPPRPFGRQALADDTFQPREHAQADRQQPDQASDAIVPLQIQGGSAPRAVLAVDPCPAPRDMRGGKPAPLATGRGGPRVHWSPTPATPADGWLRPRRGGQRQR